MSAVTSIKMNFGSIFIGACGLICLAMVVQAQYNTFDSDSNSDSNGSPILTKAELGKLVRNSAKLQNYNPNSNQHAAATRNLYNRQQPLQFAPSHNKRSNYGSVDGLAGYGSPFMGASSNGRGRNSEANDDDDSDSSAFGPNFGPSFDGESSNNNDDGDNEGSNANGGPSMNLNQAASGYPGQGDYSNDALTAGFGFSGPNGYGQGDGSEYGSFDGFTGDGRRSKSASSPLGRNYGSDDDMGASLYGPNSAVNSGERDPDDEGRSGYSPDGQGDDNDDE